MIYVDKQCHGRCPPETEARSECDRFGFLPFNTACRFLGGLIEPVANYEDVSTWVREHLYYPNLFARPREQFEPGILFPPTEWIVRHDPATDEVIGSVVGSVRPASLHRVPVSHYISLDGAPNLVGERGKKTGFLIKLFGFVQDSPTQFWDWWFDGAVSMKGDYLPLVPVVLEDFVSSAYSKWLAWPDEAQQLMISLLKMHLHAPGYYWHWERFSWEYTVTDACFRVATMVLPDSIQIKGQKKP